MSVELPDLALFVQVPEPCGPVGARGDRDRTTVEVGDGAARHSPVVPRQRAHVGHAGLATRGEADPPAEIALTGRVDGVVRRIEVFLQRVIAEACRVERQD